MIPKLNRLSTGLARRHPERILQFGGGNFLRAFFDWMVDELNDKTGFAGSVVVVKASPKGSFARPFERLRAQDGLFHVALTGLDDEGAAYRTIQLVRCINRQIDPSHDFDAFLALAQQPGLRFVVSNTTEAGIAFDPSDNFDSTPPRSFPAKLARFLYERYEHFSADPAYGCILLPLELIEQNGVTLRQYVQAYAELWQLGRDFQAWLADANTFCNTLVDRIVTGFPEAHAAQIWQETGFEDALLVEGEAYHSWIIEAQDFVQQELPLPGAGLNVKFVQDATSYRELKVRILNGAHTALVPTGYLHGLQTVRDAVEDPTIGPFVRQLLFDEVLPTLSAPGEERKQMARDTLLRFSNPHLRHELMAIALNSTSKFKARLLPSLLGYVEEFGRPPQRISLALAALICFYRGVWQGESIPLRDEPAMLAWWQSVWDSEPSMALVAARALASEQAWGQDLTAIKGLPEMVTRHLRRIAGWGIKAAVEDID